MQEYDCIAAQDAVDLFSRLASMFDMSRREFTMRYFALARHYQPDRNPTTQDLMANISQDHDS